MGKISGHTTRNAREYHTQLAKMSFDKIFDLAAGVYFHFFIRNIHIYRARHQGSLRYTR